MLIFLYINIQHKQFIGRQSGGSEDVDTDVLCYCMIRKHRFLYNKMTHDTSNTRGKIWIYNFNKFKKKKKHDNWINKVEFYDTRDLDFRLGTTLLRENKYDVNRETT